MSGALNHSPGEVVKKLLGDLALVSTTLGADWFCYHSVMPDAPDNAIVVTDTDGKSQGRTHPDGETQEHPGFQVRVRSVEKSTGFNRAQAIKRAFDTDVLRTTVVLDGSIYLVQAITIISGVIHAGYESTSRRRVYSLNAIISLRMVTTGTGS